MRLDLLRAHREQTDLAWALGGADAALVRSLESPQAYAQAQAQAAATTSASGAGGVSSVFATSSVAVLGALPLLLPPVPGATPAPAAFAPAWPVSRGSDVTGAVAPDRQLQLQIDALADLAAQLKVKYEETTTVAAAPDV
jgi:hypothetical protein